MGEGSACQPKRARVRASALTGKGGVGSICEVVGDVLEDGRSIENRWFGGETRANEGGVERVTGSSEDMSIRDS